MLQHKLIICEKPSVAQQFAAALGVSGRKTGYIENDTWIITWAVGHLVTLSYPEKYDEALKTWDIKDLPFLPKTYKYEVIRNTAEQYKIVKGLLTRPDVTEIYNAGDSGREGEYIQRLIFMMTGVEGKKPIKRVWIDSQTDEEIRRGIREAKPSSEYDRLSDAAYERAIEDYAVGINLTRALSCKFGYGLNQKIKSKNYVPITVGRVMTCVLGMIVDRENEIKNFVPTDYFRIEADHGEFVSNWKAVEGTRFFGSEKLYNDGGFKDKNDADVLTDELNRNPELKVKSMVKKIEKKKAPLLYNLAELQSECSKRFKISPDETLQVVQELYEAKLTTYPRTDARVLSTPVAKEIRKTLTGLKSISEVSSFIDEILTHSWDSGIEKTKYTDDSKITDHYAIIPTGNTNIGSLSDLQTKVYFLILRRFLAIFYPAAEYNKTSLELIHENGEMFFASEKYLIKRGYLDVYRQEDDEDELKSAGSLENIRSGDVIPAAFSVKTSTTQPPKRYTSGSMILAMENAGKLIEDEELREQIKGSGIGTSATRAETIKKLVSNGYIKLEKKTQILSPTEIGFAICDIVQENVPTMLSPRMTASWEKGLAQIEEGTISAEKYRTTLENFVRDAVNAIKEKTGSDRPQRTREIVGKCPVCGSDLYKTDSGYLCSKYNSKSKTGCKFGFGFSIAGRQMSDDEISLLLAGKSTGVLSGFQGKKGPFDAKLVVSETGQIEFEFPKEESAFLCPKCTKNLMKGKYAYQCDCGFSVPHLIAGLEIEDQQIEKLLEDGRTDLISGFTSQKGKNFEAYLVLGADGKTNFEFPSAESSMICPKCNKKLRMEKYQYSCDCGFKIPHTVAGYEFNQDEIDKLYCEGRLTGVQGFVSKSGKQFSADLVYKDGKVEFDFGENAKKSNKRKTKKNTK